MFQLPNIATVVILFRIVLFVLASDAQDHDSDAFRENRSIRRRLQVKNGVTPKAFEPWNREKNPFPCVSEDSPDTQGIFYIKVPKTSSSTMGHITQRIAGREARMRQQNLKLKVCKTYDPEVHNKASELNIGGRNKEKSFAWSVIRHPADRVISHHGMKVSHGKSNTREGTFIQAMRSNTYGPNIELRFLAMKAIPDKLSDDEVNYYVQSVIDEYNFIGIYERLYESLVVLSMLIGVEPTDVLFDFLPSTNSRCGELTRPDWVTDRIDRFLSQGEWYEREKGDFALYDAINRSLDLTIERLGKDKVQAKLDEFLKLIYVGTSFVNNVRNKAGCGIPNLHEKQQPYEDMDRLTWFKMLPEDDKKFVSEVSRRGRRQ